jgi:hypothetical protein
MDGCIDPQQCEALLKLQVEICDCLRSQRNGQRCAGAEPEVQLVADEVEFDVQHLVIGLHGGGA